VTSHFRHKTSHSRFNVMLSGFEEVFFKSSWRLSHFPGTGTNSQFLHFVTWAENLRCRFLYFHLCQLQGVGGCSRESRGRLDCYLIFGVPPRDRATYTLQHTAAHCSNCSTLQHTLLSTMQIWISFFLAINSTRLLKTLFQSCSSPPSSPYICLYLHIKLAVLLDAGL